MSNVIVCKATPSSNLALCIIKLSGENLENFIKSVIKDKLLHKRVINTNLYINKDLKINDVIVIFFKKPNSFTGDDVIEIHTYGNNFFVNIIINKFLNMGATIAKPGEFLERRYLNGKISLLECELINQKIHFSMENILELKDLVQKNMFLSISKNANFRINLLIVCIETSQLINNDPIFKDFIFIKNFLKKYKKILNILILKLNKMNILKESSYFLIIGRRNVGKSTLFNKLCLRYNSIISNISGTTRDIVKSNIKIGNNLLKIIDSAGLKLKTKNLIEKIGIVKNLNNIYNNDFLIYISDKINFKEIFFNIPIFIYKMLKMKKLIIIINKIDLFKYKKGIYKLNKLYVMFLSIKYNILINNLKCYINKFLTNLKKKKKNILNLKIIYYNFKKFYKNFTCNFDVLINDLLIYQKKMFKIIGYYSNKQIRNSYFRNFCIGK